MANVPDKNKKSKDKDKKSKDKKKKSKDKNKKSKPRKPYNFYKDLINEFTSSENKKVGSENSENSISKQGGDRSCVNGGWRPPLKKVCVTCNIYHEKKPRLLCVQDSRSERQEASTSNDQRISDKDTLKETPKDEVVVARCSRPTFIGDNNHGSERAELNNSRAEKVRYLFFR